MALVCLDLLFYVFAILFINRLFLVGDVLQSRKGPVLDSPSRVQPTEEPESGLACHGLLQSLPQPEPGAGR